MPRFFVAKNQIAKDGAVIVGTDVKHISNVLRMTCGEQITLCDGEGFDYTAVIENISKTQINVKLTDKQKSLAEPDINIVLYQAVPKNAKMEYIIQKCTELGVAEIVPVISKRCIARSPEKYTRWQKIAQEAAKQSGRAIIPQVAQAIHFSEAVLQMSKAETAIMFYEQEQKTGLKDVIGNGEFSQIAILIGPEGGFEPAEVLFAQQNNIHIVTLGKRILRTETAAAAVIPIIMYIKGQI
ncbi:MAG: 16S rRNA (uracil(1498)-N(3))-methyltransferase [Clostridiaceae bacterium]|nr:16S rRNA (uracil(1498)-N(3))-methyltransferase [Clostridiaceae bacterium]